MTAATKAASSVSGTLSIKTYSAGTEDTQHAAKVKVPKANESQGSPSKVVMEEAPMNVASTNKGKSRQVDPPPMSDTASATVREEEEEVLRTLQSPDSRGQTGNAAGGSN